MKKPDYVAIAKKYMRDVADGTVPACRYVKEAVQRQADDAEEMGIPLMGACRFDEKEARRALLVRLRT